MTVKIEYDVGDHVLVLLQGTVDQVFEGKIEARDTGYPLVEGAFLYTVTVSKAMKLYVTRERLLCKVK